jgi:hypothetical protein
VKTRITHVEFPVFSDYIVHVEITSDLEASMRRYPPCVAAMNEFKDDYSCEALTIHTDETFSFIFFQHDASAGTIAHEAWHVVSRMLKLLGVEPDGEVVAYHLGYLVNQIFKFVRGRRRAK